MNRQIKFRGKTTANGHWVYGSLVDYGNGTMAIVNKKSNPWVVPSSVGQFTGLYDRGKKPIYDGDIIVVKGQYPRIVLWDKVSWALMPTDLYHDEHFWEMNLQHPDKRWWEDFANEIEVIGNIYDDKIKEE